MESWREMICSKSYGTHSKMLADEIATLAKRLVTDTIPHDYISTLLTCRLVPLKKKDYSIRLASRCWWMPTAYHWQNNHRTAEGRHHTCSGNTADICGTGIGHRSSNTCCKEKFWRGQQWMPAVSGCRQCLQQTQQKSQSRKHQKTVSPMYTYLHNSK